MDAGWWHFLFCGGFFPVGSVGDVEQGVYVSFMYLVFVYVF